MISSAIFCFALPGSRGALFPGGERPPSLLTFDDDVVVFGFLPFGVVVVLALGVLDRSRLTPPSPVLVDVEVEVCLSGILVVAVFFARGALRGAVCIVPTILLRLCRSELSSRV
jgi:hypothetical protein